MLSLIFNRDFSNGQTVFVKSIVLQRNTGNFIRINLSLVKNGRNFPRSLESTESVLGCSDFFFVIFSIEQHVATGHQNPMAKHSCQFYFAPLFV